MGMRRTATLVLACALGSFAVALHAGASGEEAKEEKPAVEQPAPADAPLPAEPQGEAPAFTEEPAPSPPVAPEFSDGAKAPARPTTRRSGFQTLWPYDPDRNIDYSELIGMAETTEPGKPVMPPALGFRGYRANMVAVEAGDRTPGFGAMVEYSWNRLGFGLTYAFRKLEAEDANSQSQSLVGGYLLYRWLPWDFSPYFLGGVELGQATPHSFGGTVGVGMDARIWLGTTVLLGWTYHGALNKGFFGGGVGWSF